MSNYSRDPYMCRVDFWKESGKWCTTEAVSFEGLYSELIHDAFHKALARHFEGSSRLQGMRATCLEPYHEFSHPIRGVVK